MLTIFALIPGAIAIAGITIYFRKARKNRDALIGGRKEVSLHQIYATDFADCDIPEELFNKLWNELADILEVPAGRLRLTDRFQVELAPSKGYAFNDPINDVMRLVGRAIANSTSATNVESIRDYILLFKSTEKEKPKHLLA